MTFEQMMLQRSTLCLEEKKLWLYRYLSKQRIPYVDDREILVINRENLVQESFDAFQTFIDLNLHKELQIFFVGEKAQDAGGVEREWITQLIQNLLSPEFGMFRKLGGLQEVTYYFAVKKDDTNKQLQWYYFLGQIIGKALFDQIPVHFPVAKALLRMMIQKEQKFSLEDMRFFDSQMFHSLTHIKNTDITEEMSEQLMLNFQLEVYDEKGQVLQQVELIPNGASVLVNDSNKDQFIDLFVDFHLRKSVQKQIENFI